MSNPSKIFAVTPERAFKIQSEQEIDSIDSGVEIEDVDDLDLNFYPDLEGDTEVEDAVRRENVQQTDLHVVDEDNSADGIADEDSSLQMTDLVKSFIEFMLEERLPASQPRLCSLRLVDTSIPEEQKVFKFKIMYPNSLN